MSDFLKYLEKMKRELEGKELAVSKSLPMKKEWLKERNRIEIEINKIVEMKKKVENDSKKLWATICLDIDDFETEKRFNMKTDEIEILEDPDKKEEKGVKSPFSEI